LGSSTPFNPSEITFSTRIAPLLLQEQYTPVLYKVSPRSGRPGDTIVVSGIRLFGFEGAGALGPKNSIGSNWYRSDSGVGSWGGLCTCPDGQTYEVGDNGDYCGSLACDGGIAGACNSDGISSARAGMKVTCGEAPPAESRRRRLTSVGADSLTIKMGLNGGSECVIASLSGGSGDAEQNISCVLGEPTTGGAFYEPSLQTASGNARIMDSLCYEHSLGGTHTETAYRASFITASQSSDDTTYAPSMVNSSGLGCGTTFEYVVEVDSVTPGVGSAAGGLPVVISGSGFSIAAGMKVFVGEANPCVVSFVNYTTIECTTGAGSVDARQPYYGLANVKIFQPQSDRPTFTLSVTIDEPKLTVDWPGKRMTPVCSVLRGQSVCSSAGAAGIHVMVYSRTAKSTEMPLHMSIYSMPILSSKSIDFTEYEHLTAYLASLGSAVIVVIGTQGHWARYLTTALADQLVRCGADPTVRDYTIASGEMSSSPKLALFGVCGGAEYDSLQYSKFEDSVDIPDYGFDENMLPSLPRIFENRFEFNVNATPVIESITPPIGTTAGGATTNILGHGFGDEVAQVHLAGVRCATNYSDIGSYRGKHLCEWGIGETFGVNCTDLHARENHIKCLTNPIANAIQNGALEVFVPGKGFALTHDGYSYMNRWSATTTWGYTPPPVEGDSVLIKNPDVVLYDMTSPRLELVIIEGTLIFADEVDLEFNCTYIMIKGWPNANPPSMGHLQVGTEDRPHVHKAIITLHGNRRTYEIPVYGAKVIAVRYGKLDLHGTPALSWCRLNQTANPGDTEIVLDTQTYWKVGHEIVIAPTNFDHMEGEYRKIVAVHDLGQRVTLDRPLNNNHTGEWRAPVEGHSLDRMRAEVALLTRNVVVQGDDESYDLQYGCQILLHSPAEYPNSLEGRFTNVEVRQTGQGFFIGRYPIHFHLVGNVSKSYVFNSTVHHAYNRAIAIHGISGLRVKHNAVYNTRGHAFFIEDGVETDNILEGNIGILIRPVWSLLVVDQTPAIFWMTNPSNHLIGNVGAGCSHYAFWIRPMPHPDGASARTDLCPIHAPLGTFDNNVAHSTGRHGMKMEFMEPLSDGYRCSGMPVQNTMRNFFVYRVKQNAVWMQLNGNTNLQGFVTIETGEVHYEPWEHHPGMKISDSLSIGNLDSPVSHGAYTQSGQTGGFEVENTTFVSHTAAIVCCTWAGIGRNAFHTTFRSVKFVDNIHRADAIDPEIGGWSGLHKAIWHDEDGTFSGTNLTGGAVMGTSPMMLNDPLCQPSTMLGYRMSYCQRRFQRVVVGHNILKQGNKIYLHDTPHTKVVTPHGSYETEWKQLETAGGREWDVFNSNQGLLSDPPYMTGICQTPQDRWTVALGANRQYEFDWTYPLSDENELDSITNFGFILNGGEKLILTQRFHHDCMRFHHSQVNGLPSVSGARSIFADPHEFVFRETEPRSGSLLMANDDFKGHVQLPTITWGGRGWSAEFNIKLESRGSTASKFVTKILQMGPTGVDGSFKILSAPYCQDWPIECNWAYSHYDGEILVDLWHLGSRFMLKGPKIEYDVWQVSGLFSQCII
jgi:hypothetical protein